MADVTAGQGGESPGSGFPSLADIGTLLKRGDLAVAFGILTILVVLILPLPSVVLDLFLAISITLSILILMTALFIQAPLEFSAFPTILLISTMLRLSLNLASTRLILSKGHEGTAAAGHVIEAFGFGEAACTYTLLTVGDGLVTQIPALIVSTAAGLLVSKAGVSGAADKALMKQLSGYPQALGMSAGVMLVLATLPGIPMLPFLLLGGGAAFLAVSAHKRKKATSAAAAIEAAAPAAAAAANAAAEEPIATALKIDDL